MNASGSLTVTVGVRSQGLTYLPTGAVNPITANLTDPADQQTVGFGTAAGEGNLTCDFAPASIAASGTLTINLYDGSVLDVFGQPAPFRTLRMYVFAITGGGDGSGVTWGAAASNGTPLDLGGTGPTKTIYPAGLPAIGGGPGGISITSGAHSITFTNNSTTFPVSLQITLSGANS